MVQLNNRHFRNVQIPPAGIFAGSWPLATPRQAIENDTAADLQRIDMIIARADRTHGLRHLCSHRRSPAFEAVEYRTQFC